MNEATVQTITDKDGARGVIELVPDDGANELAVRLDDGRLVAVPRALLVGRQSGDFFVPARLSSFASVVASNERVSTPQAPQTANGTVAAQPAAEMIIVPVVTEELQVEKREVETGRVRIHKTVHERVETWDEPLVREEVQVERVPINQVVEGPIAVRHVGDTMIVPLLEEVLVVEKRLILKEELHITRRRLETRQPQSITLRTEEATVERLAPNLRDEAHGTERLDT